VLEEVLNELQAGTIAEAVNAGGWEDGDAGWAVEERGASFG